MISTDKAWEKFGKQDPYFGVLSHDKFTADNIHDNRDEFFETGRRSVADILRRYERHFGSLPRETVLDHGCGVGRLALPFAQQFSRVVALDVSPSMISEAKANARRIGVDNVRFELADDQISNAIGQFDFVNSYMVLQHVPVRRGLSILSRLIDKVSPAGGFHIHFSLRTDSAMSRSVWWASHHIPGVKIWQNIRCKRPWDAPAMQMNNYPLNRIAVLLASKGISESFMFTEQHAKFLTCGLIGRRPDAQKMVGPEGFEPPT